MNTGRLDNAKKLLLKNIELTRSLSYEKPKKYSIKLAFYLKQLAIDNRTTANWKDFIENIKEAEEVILKIEESNELNSLKADIMLERAIHLFQVNKYENATRILENAIEIKKKLSYYSPIELSRFYYELGHAQLFYFNDIPKAVEYLNYSKKEIEDIYGQDKPILNYEYATTLRLFGIAYENSNKEKAQEYYEEAKTIHQNLYKEPFIFNTATFSILSHSLGVFYLKYGDLKKSKTNFIKAIDLKTELLEINFEKHWESILMSLHAYCALEIAYHEDKKMSKDTIDLIDIYLKQALTVTNISTELYNAMPKFSIKFLEIQMNLELYKKEQKKWKKKKSRKKKKRTKLVKLDIQYNDNPKNDK